MLRSLWIQLTHVQPFCTFPLISVQTSAPLPSVEQLIALDTENKKGMASKTHELLINALYSKAYGSEEVWGRGLGLASAISEAMWKGLWSGSPI